MKTVNLLVKVEAPDKLTDNTVANMVHGLIIEGRLVTSDIKSLVVLDIGKPTVLPQATAISE